MLTISVSEEHLEVATDDRLEILRIMNALDLEFDTDCPVVRVSLILLRKGLTPENRYVKSQVHLSHEASKNDDRQRELF